MENTAQDSRSKMAERPVKGVYDLATLGSKTERGGVVATASTGAEFDGHPIARVGDSVRYPDGSESKIVSGAGLAAAVDRPPIAIVGSMTENGDTIVSSLQNSLKIQEFADEPVPGLLQPGYVCPEANGGPTP